LAGIRQPLGLPIIVVEDGETSEEAWEKYLAEHPEHEESDPKVVIRGYTDEERILLAKAPPSIPIKERAGR
jgi:hypothetical protein